MDKLVKESEAAEFFGVSKSTLKQSRHTGVLFGKTAPPFVRLNRSIRYKEAALEDFILQFPELRNTSEINKTR